VPIENAAMADRSVIQWDKDDLEELGLMKVDVLALGMLSMLRRTLELVSLRHGSLFEMQDIPPDDKATYDMICAADTVGVFQIESRAQMSMLPRMKPRVFYDLVIEVAVVRPGPIQGGMVHPYLRRRQGLEPVIYPEPGNEAALERTLGVPIFQEQVMQVAILGGRLHAGRGRPAAARDGGLEAQGRAGTILRPHRRGMLERGYELEFAEAIFSQIQGFGEYGFPESHAASFALLAYASSWLKCHEPAAFLCALLNSQPMGFTALAAGAGRAAPRHRGAAGRHRHQRLGVDAGRTRRHRAPAGGAPWPVAAARHAPRGAARIEDARAIRPFESVADLARRAGSTAATCRCWPAPTPCASLAGHRREACGRRWARCPTRTCCARPRRRKRCRRWPRRPRATRSSATTARRAHAGAPSAGAAAQTVAGAALHAGLGAERIPADGQLARGCGIVTVRQRPGTAKGVLFMTLEDETGNVNVIVWPDLVEQQRREVLGATCWACTASGRARGRCATWWPSGWWTCRICWAGCTA
jgi:error-prone DNA polymerase